MPAGCWNGRAKATIRAAWRRRRGAPALGTAPAPSASRCGLRDPPMQRLGFGCGGEAVQPEPTSDGAQPATGYQPASSAMCEGAREATESLTKLRVVEAGGSVGRHNYAVVNERGGASGRPLDRLAASESCILHRRGRVPK